MFKRGQLVRLHDLPHSTEFNGELARIEAGLDESDGCYEVALQIAGDDDEEDEDDDDVGLSLRVEPANMDQTCAKCHTDRAADTNMQYCARCVVTTYCSSDCQRGDWERHQEEESRKYGTERIYQKYPLYEAAANGDLAAVEWLVEQGRAKVNKLSPLCGTPFHMAAAKGHLEVVQYLVQHGADKDKADNKGCAPLHSAAGSGHTAVVVCLLSHGAKLNVRDKAGKLPVDVAATEEIKQMIRDEEQRRRDLIQSRVSASQDAAAAAAVTAAANDRLQ